MNTGRGRQLPAGSQHFHLSKWYADCVSDTGDTLIAYYGVAQWRRIKVYYSSLLTLIGSAPPHTEYSIAKSGGPSIEGTELRWRCRALGFEGTWKSIDPGHSEMVFSSEQGFVEWNCLQPRASVEVHWGKNQVRLIVKMAATLRKILSE